MMRMWRSVAAQLMVADIGGLQEARHQGFGGVERHGEIGRVYQCDGLGVVSGFG